jgi:hypothetical protein
LHVRKFEVRHNYGVPDGSHTIEGHGTVDISATQKPLSTKWYNCLECGTFTRSQENGTTATEERRESFYNNVNHGIMNDKRAGVSVQFPRLLHMIENGYYTKVTSTRMEQCIETA